MTKDELIEALKKLPCLGDTQVYFEYDSEVVIVGSVQMSAGCFDGRRIQTLLLHDAEDCLEEDIFELIEIGA